jgi:hypothetical protein
MNLSTPDSERLGRRRLQTPPPGVLKNLGGRALLREPGLCRAYAGKVLVVYGRQLPGNNLGIVL